MSMRVITPPEPFLTLGDIAGSHQSDDANIARMIAAATEELDGYTGRLGRCLAPQLLEYEGWFGSGRNWFELPIGPVLELDSLVVEDDAGTTITIDPAGYCLRKGAVWYEEGAPWVRKPMHRIRYWAGYGVRNAQDPDKWDEQVPVRIKQAITMSVQHMKALGAENLFLRSEDVEGVGSRTYTVSEQAGAIIEAAAKRLLSGLKVPRI